MLKKIRKKSGEARGRYAIIAARYNTEYTDALVRFAKIELATAESVEVFRVPGSFEIPAVAARLARSGKFDAVICFGAILRGSTTHADHIAIGVTNALAQLQIDTALPIIHGVLLFENEEQARERCLTKETNRGREAARTAIEMVKLFKTLPASAKDSLPSSPTKTS
jgi:6,7-dimethyl-8-ribityllumazine synthase